MFTPVLTVGDSKAQNKELGPGARLPVNPSPATYCICDLRQVDCP